MKKFSQSLGLLFSVIFVVTSVAVVSAEERVSANSCLDTGVGCKVGMTGPRGGIIFYDAGSQQWWGRFLEAERRATRARSIWGSTDSIYGVAGNVAAQRQSMAIGMGRVNTAVMRASGSPLATLHTSEGSDWYIPSKDELDTLYNFRTANPRTFLYRSVPFWTSTESEDSFAWYQLFQDGTQFTDENKVGQSNGNKQLRKSQVHIGSSFPSLPFHLVAMRSFPAGVGVKPTASTTSVTGNSCTNEGPCAVGDTGPAGGIVFYDAGPRSSGDRYFEVGPVETEVAGIPWKPLTFNDKQTPLYIGTASASAKVQRVLAKAFGMGEANTSKIVQRYRGGNYPARYASTLVFGGYNDWYLPSKEELRLVYRTLGTATPRLGNLGKSFYWTSSEYDLNNAWTVNFKDGQEFDREKWRVPDAAIGMKAIRTRPIRSFR